MTKQEKLARKVLAGKRISPDEAKTLLKHLGYEVQNTTGSNQTLKKGKNRITILLNKKELPGYLISQLSVLIESDEI
jgi:hypothetical protein